MFRAALLDAFKRTPLAGGVATVCYRDEPTRRIHHWDRLVPMRGSGGTPTGSRRRSGSMIATGLFGRPPVAAAARVHALNAFADACFTVSLAGSLLLSVSFEAARPRIIVYL